MQIIQSLVNGFAEAPNGTATILKRGTTTAATYYNDFEGKSPVTAGTTLVLDSAGKAQVYVNEYVDVIVLTAAGVTIEQFVPANASSNTEVRSLSFTGADYDTAAVAPGNPVPLQTVLDRALLSFGAEDWEVDVNGTPKQLSVALGAVAGLYFNVKDATYGAKGDGTNDDTSAIQSAIDAADDIGGVVYFPGTTSGYRTTSALVLPDNVSLLGVGNQDCSILLDHATNNIIQTSVAAGAVYSGQFIRGLRLAFSQANTGSALQFATSTPCSIDDCYIGGSNANPATRLFGTASGGTGTYRYTGCTFEVGGDFAQHQDAASARTVFNDCLFTSAASALNNAVSAPVGEAHYTNVKFNTGLTTTGTYTIVDLIAGGTINYASITGCRFSGGQVATVVTGVKTPSLEGFKKLTESGNGFYGVITPFDITFDESGTPVVPGASGWPGTTMSTRENLTQWVTDGTGAITMKSGSFGTGFLVVTGANASWNITLEDAYPGARYNLTVFNNSGTNITSFTVTGAVGYSGNKTLLSGIVKYIGMSFVFVHTAAGLASWIMTGESDTV